MTRRHARIVGRSRFATKAELLAGGAEVRALRYQRASQDKKETGSSVDVQGRLNVAEITRNGWTESGSFTDNDLSSSRYATKERPEFELLMEAIRAGKTDVLVVHEISRRERDLAVFVMIRDLCVEVGLLYWLLGGQVYDLRDKNDRMMLTIQAGQAEWTADSIRDNVLRGMAGAAEAGRPHGKVTYGYRRIYDSRTKALLRQEPDDESREAVAADGTVESYSPAGVVREIFEKVPEGTPLIRIEESLNARGIPSAEGSRWRRGIIRKMAMNPAYIGKRVYQGEIVGDGVWPALVGAETYWSCVRMLADPDRKTTRAGRAVHLLSYIVRCAVCDGPLSYATVNRHGWSGAVYSCLYKRCAAVKADVLDEYVQRVVVAWLARPDVYEMLTAQTGGDERAAHARAEVERLAADLEDWRKLAETNQVTAISFARAEQGLLKQIADNDRIAAEAGVPAVLRGRIGADAVAAWDKLDGDVATKREIIRVVAGIRLLRAGKGSRKPFSGERLEWTWQFAEVDTAETDAAEVDAA